MIVRGQSMEPAFSDDSIVRVNQFAYLLRRPTRGDVVAVRSPEASDRVELKRIIGLPGETVCWVGSGGVEIDGRPLPEPYARMSTAVPGDEERSERLLDPGAYFVMGDHRLYSRDSRHYGPILRSAILGKVS